MMLKVPFTISSQAATNEENRLISFSIPFRKSTVYSVDSLAIIAVNHAELNLTSRNHTQVPIQVDFKALTLWPDGSIKWLQCNFISLKNIVLYAVIEQSINDEKLKNNVLSTQKVEKSSNTKNSDVISIECVEHTYLINKSAVGFNCLPWSVEFIDNNNKMLSQHICEIQHNKNEQNLTTTVNYSGYFGESTENQTLEFDAKLTFCHQLNSVQVDFTLRNTKPMVNKGGKWDLGNENSILFNACNVVFDYNNNIEINSSLSPKIQINTHQAWQDLTNENTLFQASSGGKNWQSNNHFDANRENKLAFKGYQFTNNKTLIEHDVRATPSLLIPENKKSINEKSTKNNLYVHLKNFWQNFPKSIQATDKTVLLGLFPSQHYQPHELQPGEQKTHTFFIVLNESTLQNIQQLTTVKICPNYLASTQTLPFFSASKDNVNQDGIDKLIQLGLSHKNNFFEKREQIDEFGWRSFGDIYADHETLEYEVDENTTENIVDNTVKSTVDNAKATKEQILISHYNNQYDPLYGFLRQYLLSNNDNWWQLAQDLAQHVKDIDIYHTDKDKAEYNHGLFWHTDHYLPAETATHRTYSKHQKADAYQDHAGGGGPGGQHCYTTGLALHYLLTGDETSKTTVIKLAKWITHVYEGNSTFLDTLLKIKNSEYPGVKNIITGQYPLDRGTGNYIVALIDAYQVSNKQSYLDQASLIIKNTVSPTENLADRNLDNIEESWFYTVFLQAVGRYLQTKEQLNQYDESFCYAQSVLLHFADWMTEHEQPYLATPEVLEYPNHTWTAQDIRKANVLYLASYYAQNSLSTQNLNNLSTKITSAKKYKQKADSLYSYVEEELNKESTHYFTRILSILMQNHGIKSYVDEYMYSLNKHNPALSDSNALNKIVSNLEPNYRTTEQDKKSWKILLNSLANTSVKAELTWLRQRVKKVDDLLLKLGSKP